MKKIKLLVLILMSALSLQNMPASANTFYGETPTGLLELQNFRYPVYLYVPPTYKTSRTYPFLIVLPEIGEAPEKKVQEWMGVAKKKGLIVLVPELKMRIEDVPYQMDEWILRVKRDITGRYKTSPEKIYLIGYGSGGAHYASYLGLRYPQEFAAAALIGGSWVGPFEKLMQLKSRPKKQIPFYAAVPVAGASQPFDQTEKKAYAMTQKGYPVYLERLENPKSAATADYQTRVLDWMQEKSQSWAQVRTESQKKLKEKISASVEDFFSTE